MPESERWLDVRTDDDRRLEVVVDPDASGIPFVFHGATPGAAVWGGPMPGAARAAGLRLIMYSRPGYAGSSPSPRRTVGDAARDVAAILDTLDAERFLTMGWSGGGPHALACAALLPARCLAATTLAGVAPYPADGIDWMTGMADENVEEFSAALRGEGPLTDFLEPVAVQLANVQGDAVAASLGGLVPEVDKRALTGEFADVMAAGMRRAVSNGIAGWRDDDLAFTRPWGFELASIRRPVAVWQGGEDRMVPFEHGKWLAGHIPNARRHLYPEEGHLSLGVGRLTEILKDLASMPGRLPAPEGSRTGRVPLN